MLTRDEIQDWLLEEDEARLSDLWQRADDTRREHVGDAVDQCARIGLLRIVEKQSCKSSGLVDLT